MRVLCRGCLGLLRGGRGFGLWENWGERRVFVEREVIPIGVVSNSDTGDRNTPRRALLNNARLAERHMKLQENDIRDSQRRKDGDHAQ